MGVLEVGVQEQVQVGILNTDVRVGLIEVFEWTGGGKRVSCVDTWESNVLDRGGGQCQGPRWDCASGIGNNRMVNVPRMEWSKWGVIGSEVKEVTGV